MSEIYNLSISEKFEKELVTFMLWISDSNYKISQTRESEELDWSIDLLSSFEEPGRNKLECFIKELKKMYFISYNDQEINDIKSITKNFRENKSKISKNIKVKKNVIKVVQEEEGLVKEEVVEEVVKKVVKKEVVKKEVVKEEVVKKEVVKDIYKLDLKTESLVEVLGMPKYCKNEYIKYKWDIKCEKTGKLFMVYNWVKEDGLFEVFEKTEWYLVEVMDGSYLSPSYMDFMNFFKNAKDITKEKIDNVEFLNPDKDGSLEEKLEDRSLEEKLEDRSLEEKLEDLEIDLDDIEF
jgi:hypothetical protein